MKSPRVRVLGIGRPFAGDDAVGLAVLRELGGRELPPGLALAAEVDAMSLLPLLLDAERVILVDAFVDGGTPGRLRVFRAGELPAHARELVSTHGAGVVETIGLANALEPGRVAPEVLVVGVSIEAPRGPSAGLSPAVARAVPGAVDEILSLAGSPSGLSGPGVP